MSNPYAYAIAGAALFAIIRGVYERFLSPPADRPDLLRARIDMLEQENSRLRQQLADARGGSEEAIGGRVAYLAKIGNKVAAIREYRSITGASLEDARSHVEELLRQTDA